MSDLQQVDPADPGPHLLLSGKPGVAGEQDLKVAVLDQEYQRVLVQVLTPPLPGAIGVQDSEVQTVQLKVLSASPNMPGDGVGRELLQEPVVQRVRNQLARLDHEPGMKSLEHGGNTAEVVSVCVRHEGEGQVSRPMTHQKGYHHAPPRIVPVSDGPGVDQNPPARRRLQDGTVSL